MSIFQASSVDSSLKEDHIYATLSETFGSMSSFSDGYMQDDNRCPSVTTVANDDFEFHDPRTSGCSSDLHPMGRSPCHRQQSYSSSCCSSAAGLTSYNRRVRENSDTLVMTSAYNPHVSVNIQKDMASRPPADLPLEAYGSRLNRNHYNVYNVRTPSDLVLEKNWQNKMNRKVECPVAVHDGHQIGYDDYQFESDTLEKKYYMQKLANESVVFEQDESRRKIENEVSDGTLSRKHRISSLSMNDLDKFDKSRDPNSEEQMMFLLPVKSESMLSLYRLYLAEDEQESSTSLHYSIELSKSENDLSVVKEEQDCLSIGHSIENIQSSPHEIYQKRRRPQSSASKVRRQHKIQRAKGLHSKSRPQITPKAPSTSHGNRSISVPHANQRQSAPESPEYGVHLAIVDKSRRPNGIITIRDPSGLSVQELFSVLNRATAASNVISGTSRAQVAFPAKNGVTNIPVPSNEYQSLSSEAPIYTSSTGQVEFKKIFVSEYL